MKRWDDLQTPAEYVPTPTDFAAAERAYANACRQQADALSTRDDEQAARLRLEADVCDMWAYEIETSESDEATAYCDALNEYQAVARGDDVPRGGLFILLENETNLAH